MHVAMVLTDKKIRELVKKEELIVPFNESNLQSESYDVTIGTEITELSKEIHCIDISKQETVNNIYINIDISENGYIISPKQYLLVSLRETLKVPDDITVHLRPKTRYTRLGLLVTDQHCNSTYSGHLRIGLFNATEYPIHIYPDYTIAQLVFEELDRLLKNCIKIEKMYIIRTKMVHSEVRSLMTNFWILYGMKC